MQKKGKLITKYKKNYNIPVNYAEECAKDTKYKTERCKRFYEIGDCEYGLQCRYAHGENELRSKNLKTNYKQKNCEKFHGKGFCEYGERCDYKHLEEKIGDMKRSNFHYALLGKNFEATFIDKKSVSAFSASKIPKLINDYTQLQNQAKLMPQNNLFNSMYGNVDMTEFIYANYFRNCPYDFNMNNYFAHKSQTHFDNKISNTNQNNQNQNLPQAPLRISNLLNDNFPLPKNCETKRLSIFKDITGRRKASSGNSTDTNSDCENNSSGNTSPIKPKKIKMSTKGQKKVILDA